MIYFLKYLEIGPTARLLIHPWSEMGSNVKFGYQTQRSLKIEGLFAYHVYTWHCIVTPVNIMERKSPDRTTEKSASPRHQRQLTILAKTVHRISTNIHRSDKNKNPIMHRTRPKVSF